MKRKWEEVGEEKAEAIRAHVKVALDVKDQEDLAKTHAKTQASKQALSHGSTFRPDGGAWATVWMRKLTCALVACSVHRLTL